MNQDMYERMCKSLQEAKDHSGHEKKRRKVLASCVAAILKRLIEANGQTLAGCAERAGMCGRIQASLYCYMNAAFGPDFHARLVLPDLSNDIHTCSDILFALADLETKNGHETGRDEPDAGGGGGPGGGGGQRGQG